MSYKKKYIYIVKPLFLLVFFFSNVLMLHAQPQSEAALKSLVDSINRMIDHAVVQKKISLLETLYADDFVFTHGTGLVDSKSSWLKNVSDTSVHYISREHDSTKVELHNDIALITGKLTVKRQQRNEINSYALWYVRVYAHRKNQWQLISHRTTSEWHLN